MVAFASGPKDLCFRAYASGWGMKPSCAGRKRNTEEKQEQNGRAGTKEQRSAVYHPAAGTKTRDALETKQLRGWIQRARERAQRLRVLAV